MAKHVKAGVLSVADEEGGPPGGTPVVLLHGFPYDGHAFDEVAPLRVSAGCRVIAPYLRGHGPTRFLSGDTPRSGQQAALAHDLLALMDALEIQNGVLAGDDWGGRAACIVAALWPERARGLVSGGGYNIQDNPDFVAVVIHSYRHRFGLAPGDPAVGDTERRLTGQPPITVPTVVLHGSGNGVMPVGGSEHHDRFFRAAYARRVVPVAGHNLPQEAPRDFAAAVLSVL